MNINFIWCSFIHSNFLLDQLSRSTLTLTHAYIQRYLPWSWPSFCCFWSEWCVCVCVSYARCKLLLLYPKWWNSVEILLCPSIDVCWSGWFFVLSFFSSSLLTIIIIVSIDHVFLFLFGDQQTNEKKKKECDHWILMDSLETKKKNTFIAFFAWTIKIFVLPFFFVSYFVFSFWPQTWLSTVTTPWPHWRHTHTQKLYCRISDIFSTTTKYRFRYSLFFSKECFSMFFLDDDSVKTIKTKHIYTIETSLWWWWWP